MASLPFDVSDKTTIEVLSPIRVSRAVDGTLRYIDMSASTWSKMMCVVEGLDDDDRDTLMTFLDTNETSEIDVGVNGTTYRGRIIPENAPRWEKSQGRNLVSFGLQVKAV